MQVGNHLQMLIKHDCQRGGGKQKHQNGHLKSREYSLTLPVHCLAGIGAQSLHRG